MSDDVVSEEVVDEELLTQQSESSTDDEVAVEEEPIDPLEEALTRAEKAENLFLRSAALVPSAKYLSRWCTAVTASSVTV